MIRAAATGRLDYRQAHSDDIVWRLKERLLLSEMERDILVDIGRIRHLQDVGTTVWPAGDRGDMYKAQYDRGSARISAIGQLIAPFLHWTDADRYKSEAQSLREEYIKKFGDPSAPENKARAARDMEALNRSNAAAQQKQSQEQDQRRQRDQQLQTARERRFRWRQ